MRTLRTPTLPLLNLLPARSSRLALFLFLTLLSVPQIHADGTRRPLNAKRTSAWEKPLASLGMPLVRVGLMRFSAPALTLYADPGAGLQGPDGHEIAAGMGPWTLTLTPDGIHAVDASGHEMGVAGSGACWRLQSQDGATRLGIALPGKRLRFYRGCLEIGASGGRLRAIDEVDLEDYVRGVIAGEMGAHAPLEALKAQAVASRTYALHSLGHWPAAGYDLRDTTDSQVYNGIDSETPATDRAVRETSGLILTMDGRPIAAMFCADCGGVTAPGASPDDLPRSVNDAEAHGPPDSPHPAPWTRTYTPERLAALLGKVPQACAPGMLEAIRVVETDVSGRARRLQLTWRPVVKPAPEPLLPPIEPSVSPPANGDKETPPTVQEPDESPPSAKKATPKTKQKPQNLPPPVLREIGANTLRTLLGVDTLRSTLFTVRRSENGAFVFTGRGWGHGRGLCQVGAIALAAPPYAYDFRAILQHYYAGARLTRVDFAEGEGDPADTESIRQQENRGSSSAAKEPRRPDPAVKDRKAAPYGR